MGRRKAKSAEPVEEQEQFEENSEAIITPPEGEEIEVVITKDSLNPHTSKADSKSSSQEADEWEGLLENMAGDPDSYDNYAIEVYRRGPPVCVKSGRKLHKGLLETHSEPIFWTDLLRITREVHGGGSFQFIIRAGNKFYRARAVTIAGDPAPRDFIDYDEDEDEEVSSVGGRKSREEVERLRIRLMEQKERERERDRKHEQQEREREQKEREKEREQKHNEMLRTLINEVKESKTQMSPVAEQMLALLGTAITQLPTIFNSIAQSRQAATEAQSQVTRQAAEMQANATREAAAASLQRAQIESEVQKDFQNKILEMNKLQSAATERILESRMAAIEAAINDPSADEASKRMEQLQRDFHNSEIKRLEKHQEVVLELLKKDDEDPMNGVKKAMSTVAEMNILKKSMSDDDAGLSMQRVIDKLGKPLIDRALEKVQAAGAALTGESGVAASPPVSAAPAPQIAHQAPPPAPAPAPAPVKPQGNAAEVAKGAEIMQFLIRIPAAIGEGVDPVAYADVVRVQLPTEFLESLRNVLSVTEFVTRLGPACPQELLEAASTEAGVLWLKRFLIAIKPKRKRAAPKPPPAVVEDKPAVVKQPENTPVEQKKAVAVKAPVFENDKDNGTGDSDDQKAATPEVNRIGSTVDDIQPMVS